MKVIDFRTQKFVMVPQSLVKDSLLNKRDKVVYMSLCLFANNETKQAYPSTQTIATIVGCSRNNVFKSLRSLENGGYIKREGRAGETNIYYLLDK